MCEQQQTIPKGNSNNKCQPQAGSRHESPTYYMPPPRPPPAVATTPPASPDKRWNDPGFFSPKRAERPPDLPGPREGLFAWVWALYRIPEEVRFGWLIAHAVGL